MITFRYYDKDRKVDHIWYESSNIVYSECLDKENDFKTLTVVFKNGATYDYKNVDVNDYVMFVHGGVDGSNGKALNKYIKPKYQCERQTNKDLLELETMMRKFKSKKLEENTKEEK